MRTSDQRTEGPDEPPRALTRRLADLRKADPAKFASLVRQHDALVTAGAASRAEAWQQVLSSGSPPAEPSCA